MLGPDPSDGTLPAFAGWQTLEKLGEGGMCAVYRARPDDGGPERAIKVLTDRSEASIRRFVDEARLLQRIDHPNVVRVHHLDADARPPWLVMDLLGGRDLEETMRLEGPMDPERAARLFADLASGLAAVHAAGVRHRDLKPANIRLGTDGVARLIDFGIARDATAARQTKAGYVVGTASYLPPEIFADDDAHGIQDTEQADVYALGQTLCEVLQGHAVHGARDGTEASVLVRIMRDKLEREHLDPRDTGAKVPEALALVVRRATTREPKARTPTARAFEQELREWLTSRDAAGRVAPVTRVDPSALSASPVELRPPTPLPAPPRVPTPAPAPSRVARTAAVGAVGAMGMAGVGLVGAGLLLVLVLGGAALWFLRPGADPQVAAVLRTVDAAGGQLAICRPGPGEVVVALTVRDGRADRVDVVRSTLDRHTEKCVTRVLGKLTYPRGKPATVEVPVRFR